MNESDKLSELNATVVNKTREALEEMSELTGLTVGEIIDRMMLTCSPKDVSHAYLLIMDNIMISTKNLDDEQFDDVVLQVLKAFESAFKENERAEIRETLQLLVDKLVADKKNIGGTENG